MKNQGFSYSEKQLQSLSSRLVVTGNAPAQNRHKGERWASAGNVTLYHAHSDLCIFWSSVRTSASWQNAALKLLQNGSLTQFATARRLGSWHLEARIHKKYAKIGDKKIF